MFGDYDKKVNMEDDGVNCIGNILELSSKKWMMQQMILLLKKSLKSKLLRGLLSEYLMIIIRHTFITESLHLKFVYILFMCILYILIIIL